MPAEAAHRVLGQGHGLVGGRPDVLEVDEDLEGAARVVVAHPRRVVDARETVGGGPGRARPALQQQGVLGEGGERRRDVDRAAGSAGRRARVRPTSAAPGPAGRPEFLVRGGARASAGVCGSPTGRRAWRRRSGTPARQEIAARIPTRAGPGVIISGMSGTGHPSTPRCRAPSCWRNSATDSTPTVDLFTKPRLFAIVGRVGCDRHCPDAAGPPPSGAEREARCSRVIVPPASREHRAPLSGASGFRAGLAPPLGSTLRHRDSTRAAGGVNSLDAASSRRTGTAPSRRGP